MMTPSSSQPILHGASIIDAIKAADVRYVLSVPDLHTAQGLLAPLAADRAIKLIRTCKEDETFGIAAGLSYGDQRALILIQYTGFLYAMNAIRAMACEQSLPMCMMIGLLGKEAGVEPIHSTRYGVRITEPLLDVLGIKHICVHSDDDVALIAPAIDEAYRTSRPLAILIGTRPLPPQDEVAA
jgi:sulfopyruvate decarboxylase TPP-binding subunit